MKHPNATPFPGQLQPTHEFLSQANRTQEEVEEEVDWENAAAHVSDQDDEDTE